MPTRPRSGRPAPRAAAGSTRPMRSRSRPDWSSQAYVSLAIMAVAISLIALLTARPHRPTAAPSGVCRGAPGTRRGGRAAERDPAPGIFARPPRPSTACRLACGGSSMIARACWRRSGTICARPLPRCGCGLEFVADAGEREKLLATLDEMQAMAETALAFAREESAGEPTRTIDLAALLESLSRRPRRPRMRYRLRRRSAHAVSLPSRGPAPRRSQPDPERAPLWRAGAGRCAARATPSKSRSTTTAPAFPRPRFEQVFAPFVRLEGSRNRQTGEVGLGLSIVRTIARDHGGDVLLVNRPAGGLRATIVLPAALNRQRRTRLLPDRPSA